MIETIDFYFINKVSCFLWPAFRNFMFLDLDLLCKYLVSDILPSLPIVRSLSLLGVWTNLLFPTWIHSRLLPLQSSLLNMNGSIYTSLLVLLKPIRVIINSYPYNQVSLMCLGSSLATIIWLFPSQSLSHNPCYPKLSFLVWCLYGWCPNCGYTLDPPWYMQSWILYRT
jgi:hypothetical protein